MGALMRAVPLVLALLWFISPATAANPFVPSPKAGATWCAFAEQFLWNRSEDRAFKCSVDATPRCIKYNNYGCLKHSPGKPYAGTPAPNGQLGAHDGVDGARGHAIFEHPKWSVAASFFWFEKSYKKLGLKTAKQLAERYSPWCDTQGSVATKRDAATGRVWGRTCGDGQQPPASFHGPLCKEPASAPSNEQCRVCNCPSVFVKSWLKGTGKTSTDVLELFASDGKPTALMQSILVNHTPWEIGYRPSTELIKQGAELFVPQF